MRANLHQINCSFPLSLSPTCLFFGQVWRDSKTYSVHYGQFGIILLRNCFYPRLRSKNQDSTPALIDEDNLDLAERN